MNIVEAIKQTLGNIAKKDYQNEVDAGTRAIIRLVLFITSVNTLLTPVIFTYLDKHMFRPSWLNDLWGLMLVVFIITTLFWVVRVIVDAARIVWLLPLAALCALLSLLLVTKQVSCTFNENIPKQTFIEVRTARGWPFTEYACNSEPPSGAVTVGVNTLYWSSLILSFIETFRSLKKKKH
jgi:hypothetical protein